MGDSPIPLEPTKELNALDYLSDSMPSPPLMDISFDATDANFCDSLLNSVPDTMSCTSTHAQTPPTHIPPSPASYDEGAMSLYGDSHMTGSILPDFDSLGSVDLDSLDLESFLCQVPLTC